MKFWQQWTRSNAMQGKIVFGQPDEEFANWKFAFLSLGRPEYLQDADIVSHRFQRRDFYGAWEQYLGLEHSDNTSKRIHQIRQNWSMVE